MKKFSMCLIFLFILTNLCFGNKLDVAKCYKDSYKYEKNSNYNDAIRVILPVLKKYSKNYNVNLRLGWLSYLNKKYADAEKYYTVSVKYNNYSFEPKLGLTLVLLATEKYDSVVKICNSIIKKDYYNYYANLRLAYALSKQGKISDAEIILKKMLYIYPTNVTFLTELGKNYYLQKKYIVAYKVFYNVLSLDPENYSAKYFLYKKN